MVEKVIRANKDFGLRTYFGKHRLTKGEEKRIRFRNQRGFEALLRMGNFIEVQRSAGGIPIILPEVTEDIVVEVEHIDKLEKEPQSTVLPEVTEDTIVGVDPIDKIASPEGINPDKPDLPCPEEDQRPAVEEPKTSHPEIGKYKIINNAPIKILSNGEIPVEDVALDEAGEPESKEKETPEDLRRSEPAIEEIPIEEQDKSKSTRLSDVIDRP